MYILVYSNTVRHTHTHIFYRCMFHPASPLQDMVPRTSTIRTNSKEVRNSVAEIKKRTAVAKWSPVAGYGKGIPWLKDHSWQKIYVKLGSKTQTELCEQHLRSIKFSDLCSNLLRVWNWSASVTRLYEKKGVQTKLQDRRRVGIDQWLLAELFHIVRYPPTNWMLRGVCESWRYSRQLECMGHLQDVLGYWRLESCRNTHSEYCRTDPLWSRPCHQKSQWL